MLNNHLIQLTRETGLQLDYTALIPVIMKKVRQEGKPIPIKQIHELRDAHQQVLRQIHLEPNYLAMFLEQLADNFESYNSRTSNDSMTYKLLLFAILVLFILFLYVRS